MDWLGILAAITITEEDIVKVARHYNEACLSTEWCQRARGKYFIDEALYPVAAEIITQSNRSGVHPLWVAAYIQEQSEWVSDAVSRHNKIKPHPQKPWDEKPEGRKNWCGLDFGIAQLHVPSKWANCTRKESISELKDPVLSLQHFGEWMSQRVSVCERKKTKLCREMEKATGQSIHRKVGILPRLMRNAVQFLMSRSDV